MSVCWMMLDRFLLRSSYYSERDRPEEEVSVSRYVQEATSIPVGRGLL